jgi:glycerol-3-phosphate acyltransferase PlsY
MSPWWLAPIAYLAGSIPWGLLIVRLVKRVDVRDYGSRKTGMTNVLRTAGKLPAILVLAADTGKGVGMVIAARVATDDAAVHAAVAGAVLAGHIWPIFAGFRGGRGIAPGMGASGGLEPWVVLIGVSLFVPVVATTRYISLGSLAGVLAVAVSFAVMAAANTHPAAYLGYVGPGALLVFWMHRDNIRRLLKGTERRLGKQAR